MPPTPPGTRTSGGCPRLPGPLPASAFALIHWPGPQDRLTLLRTEDNLIRSGRIAQHVPKPF